MSESFFLPLDGPDGARFHATVATTGPWFADAQHAGPPTALLVRALERCAPQPDTQIGRITVDVLGPIPAGEVTVRAAVERPGRSVALLAAELSAGGRVVLRARAWRLVVADTADVATSPADGAAPPLPPPTEARLRTDLPPGWLPGFLDALEWRWLSGWLGDPGPGTVWARQRVPLVADEEPSPLQRVLVVADSGNGISSELNMRKWHFINPELTVHLHREPVGEWVCLDAATTISSAGVGLATSVLSDVDGPVGVGAQTLLVARR